MLSLSEKYSFTSSSVIAILAVLSHLAATLPILMYAIRSNQDKRWIKIIYVILVATTFLLTYPLVVSTSIIPDIDNRIMHFAVNVFFLIYFWHSYNKDERWGGKNTYRAFLLMFIMLSIAIVEDGYVRFCNVSLIRLTTAAGILCHLGAAAPLVLMRAKRLADNPTRIVLMTFVRSLAIIPAWLTIPDRSETLTQPSNISVVLILVILGLYYWACYLRDKEIFGKITYIAFASLFWAITGMACLVGLSLL